MRKNIILLAILLASATSSTWAMQGANPFLVKSSIERLEANSNSNDILLEGGFLAGYDLNKAYIDFDISNLLNPQNEMEISLGYQKAISAFFDIKAGVRGEIEDSSIDNYFLTLGLSGLAPYFVEVDLALVASTKGVHIENTFEYEYMLTRKLQIITEIEANFGVLKDEDNINSTLEIGGSMMLGYAIKPELIPYIGVGIEGEISSEGIDKEQKAFIGLHYWY